MSELLVLDEAIARGPRDCRDCIHFHISTESWEMPHIGYMECGKHPNYENLRSFPFRDTKCPDYTKRTP